MKITGLDHIVLRVRDLEASLGFYGDLLGMERIRVDEWRAGKVNFPSLRVSEGTIIDLFPLASDATEAGRDERRNLDHYCLQVAPEEWEGLLGELQRLGVAPGGDPLQRWGARGRGTSVYIHDPDGNQLELKSYL